MASGPTSIRQELDDAQNTLNSTGIQKKTKALEKGLDVVGNAYDRVSDPASNPALSIIPDAAKEVWQTLQPRLQNWEQRYELLEKALDSIAGLHPAIGVAVIVFKAAIQFEVTRRQNDQKIAILRVTMMNTMEELTCLESVLPADRATAEDLIGRHLEGIIKDITAAIKRCATTCDSYQNRHVIIRALKSLPWAQKLKGFVDEFDELKDRLRDAIQLHIAGSVQQSAVQLTSLGAKIDSVLLLFQNLRTPSEQRVYDFLWRDTPPDQRSSIVQDDRRVDALLREFGKPAADGPEGPAAAAKAAVSMDVGNEIKWELKSDLDDILRKWNDASFAKFEASQEKLKAEMQTIIQRDGDRVISRILAGPHDSIKDPGIWKVWTEMGWRRCTESRLLVKALREYYAEIYACLLDGHDEAALVPVAMINDGSHAEGTEHAVEAYAVGVDPRTVKKAKVFSVDDGWTLKYISMLGVHPLLEMLDQDYSSWVTVHEINIFTEARPANWSVPSWMAYWTIGQALSTAYYYAKTQQVLWSIHQAWKQVLPSNRILVDAFMSTYAGVNSSLHRLLAGAYTVAKEVIEEQDLFDKFKSYIFDKERRLKSFLEKIRYYLDAPNAVTLLLGSDRLEEHLLPIFYLMASRIRAVVESAKEKPLHEKELSDLAYSHGQLIHAVFGRIETIKKDICGVNDLPEKDTLKKFASGLYFYLAYEDTDWRLSDYYQEFSLEDKIPPLITPFGGDADDGTPPGDAAPQSVLRYGPIELLDYESYDTPPAEAPAALDIFYPPEGQTPGAADLPVLWQGLSWYGPYEMTRIEIDMPAEAGDIRGFGLYIGGEFRLRGVRDGASVMLRTTRIAAPGEEADEDLDDVGVPERSFFSGAFTEAGDTIAGLTAHSRPDEDVWNPVQDHEKCCTFSIQPNHPEYFAIFRPPQDAFEQSRPKALWAFAREAIFHVVRAKLKKIPRWAWFKAIRDRRLRYIELYSRGVDRQWTGKWGYSCLAALVWDEIVELQTIERMIPLATIRFWRSLAYLLMRSQVMHDIWCDVCPKQGLRRTRLVCLDCLTWLRDKEGAKASTLDLCIECGKLEFTSAYHQQPHKPSHRLLQVRRPIMGDAAATYWASEGMEKIEAMFSDEQPKVPQDQDQDMQPGGEADGTSPGEEPQPEAVEGPKTSEESGEAGVIVIAENEAVQKVNAGDDVVAVVLDGQAQLARGQPPEPDQSISSAPLGGEQGVDPQPEQPGDTINKACARCKEAVTPLFWYCVECSGATYVCESCNLQDDKDRSTLVTGWQEDPVIPEKRPAEGAQHQWEHMMVLWQKRPDFAPELAPVTEAKPSESPTQDDRLKAVEDRAQRLEDHLLQMKSMLALLTSHFKLPIETSLTSD